MTVTNSQSGTNVHEVADGIYRINTPVQLGGGGGFSFNQYLIVDDAPLLFHTGPRKMFPLVREAVASVLPVAVSDVSVPLAMVTSAGVTARLRSTAAVTVSAAVPVKPPAAAVMVEIELTALPTATVGDKADVIVEGLATAAANYTRPSPALTVSVAKK